VRVRRGAAQGQRLLHRQAELAGQQLDGRRREAAAAPRGPIGLREDERHRRAVVDERA
jgi:hypothetical protein